MNGKKVKRIIVAAALIAVLAIGGISAYFTDGDTATNTFTVGSVQIDLQEPHWNPTLDTDGKMKMLKITPEQEIAKDPQVKNIGVNDAFVFLEVVVPYAKVVTAQEDGTKNTAADTELFSYNVNPGWVEVGTGTKDNVAKTVTHLYAYGTSESMNALAKDAITGTLFDWVRFANVVEDQGLEETSPNVLVNAYAIQTTNINDGKTRPDQIDGVNNDGKVKPAEVWAVLSNQEPSKDKIKAGYAENAKTDILEPVGP